MISSKDSRTMARSRSLVPDFGRKRLGLNVDVLASSSDGSSSGISSSFELKFEYAFQCFDQIKD